MNLSKESNQIEKNSASFRLGYLLFISISISALVATFIISNSALRFEFKALIFGFFILLYLVFGGVFYLWQKRQIYSPALEVEKQNNDPESGFTPEIKEKLLLLEEAGSLFAASLKPDDMFRLAADRVRELIPFVNCALFLANENKTKLKIVQAAGENAFDLLGTVINSHSGLAGKSFMNCQIRLDKKLQLEKEIFKNEALNNCKTAIAAPLFQDKSEVFGVITLYGNSEDNYDNETIRLLKEISLKISPLLAKSLNFERILEGSLKDTLTDLPNERAFYLVLENQIAESRRGFEQRPLTILSMDIKNFDDLNKKIGHNAANQILKQAAKIIKGQLRQMDLLARSTGDEFLAVLPTATEEITKLIIERIEKAFAQNSLKIIGSEEIYMELNFGASSFMKDGETAQVLLKRAILNKSASKSGLKGSVINFPRDYVN